MYRLFKAIFLAKSPLKPQDFSFFFGDAVEPLTGDVEYGDDSRPFRLPQLRHPHKSTERPGLF